MDREDERKRTADDVSKISERRRNQERPLRLGWGWEAARGCPAGVRHKGGV